VSRDRLTIGSFAVRCRLSVKALRHYDELGLLRPDHVDLATGYRWYDRRQAPVAIAIALLRSLDVPLPAIRDLLAGGGDADTLTEILDRERARRAREIARAESALRSIERLVRAGTVFPYEVIVRDEPAVTLLVVEGTTSVDTHVAFGHALVADLMARFGCLGLRATGPVECLMPETDDPDTMCLQMGAPVAAAPDGERVVALPAGPAAVTRHVGPYEEVGLADLALHAWVEEHGYDVAGLLRERYLNDPAEVPRDVLETEVILPIRRRAAGTRGTAAARR
jgi:DNA-binding transcriptional MerR regulator